MPDPKDKNSRFSERMEALRRAEHTPALQMVGARIMGALFILVAVLMFATATEPFDATNIQLIMAGVFGSLGIAFFFAKPHKPNPRTEQVPAVDLRIRYAIIAVLLAVLGLLALLDR